MHDDATDSRTEAFLEELRLSFYVPEAPAPGPALTSLFADLANDKGDLSATAGSNATRSAPQIAGLPNWTRRRIDMMKGLLSQLGTKVAAGAVGAVLALGGLGAAGIAPVSLINHEETEHDCVELDELADNYDENIVVCETAEQDDGGDVSEDGAETAEAASEETDDVEESEEPETGAKGDLPPVPTTTSGAAQIHAFDEACGNHGMYVSFFAQMGFEPPCALLARSGEEPAEDMTRHERKKAALRLRKECKARAKAGNPCTAEEFAPTTDAAEQDVTSATDAAADDEGASTTDNAVEDRTSTAVEDRTSTAGGSAEGEKDKEAKEAKEDKVKANAKAEAEADKGVKSQPKHPSKAKSAQSGQKGAKGNK